ncbi:hypothetical protein HUC46_23485 [Escherichia coli]|nr:hypothetical protein [Escherichia coli]NUC02765.1 hypothetical protein [Escherichia coli]
MTQSREIDLTAGSQHLRQFPLDGARVARICKMTEAQANAIRDMNTDELQKQIFVTPVEFAGDAANLLI